MFKNYLITSLRFLAKNKAFTLLNIVGLTIGTLCCVYILLYVRDQYSYDRHFTAADRIYRVVYHTEGVGEGHYLAATSPPVAKALATEFSNEITATRVIPTIGSDEHLLIYNNKGIYEKDACLVDDNFFRIFDFHFLEGDPDAALTGPNAVVLQKRLADKLFGDDDPIGKNIVIQNSDGDNGFVVKGVIDESQSDGENKSSIHANIFFSINSGGFGHHFNSDNQWSDHNYVYTFVKLKPGESAKTLEANLPGFLGRHTNSRVGDLKLQPLTSIHTTSGYAAEMSKTVSGFFLAVLFAIAAMIQLIACINFMNLATARASKRAKEVGVRKIIGAENKGLILQFLGESFSLSLIAVLITMPLLIAFLPWLNHVTGADIPRSVFADPAVWALLAVIALITGLLAGSYPAFYLSAFQAPKVLKGDLSSHISVAGIRRSLVVFQFVLSIILIASVVIIRRQLDYMQNKDLGFSKDEQLVFNFHTYATRRCADYFAIALRQFPEIVDASRTDNYPGGTNYRDERIYTRGEDQTQAINTQTLSCDEHFLKTMGIQLISGRDFHTGDTGVVIINQTLARQLKLDSAQSPVTGIITASGRRYTIAGVMKDFNYQSLHEKVSPFMIAYEIKPDGFNHLIVRTTTRNYSALMARMEVFWRRRVFVAPFEWSFMTDVLKKMYDTELIMARIIDTFTVMAILISCLGLFGLAAFNAEQRTKEIGIRKVMGASVARIVRLLSADFFKLIGISIAVSVPITWWIMNNWLNALAYHIGIPWWLFAAAGGSVMIVAMSVVSFQAMKAAIVNPVESLRT